MALEKGEKEYINTHNARAHTPHHTHIEAERKDHKSGHETAHFKLALEEEHRPPPTVASSGLPPGGGGPMAKALFQWEIFINCTFFKAF